MHLCAKHAGCARKLLEGPARNFGYHVVDHWLETRRRHLGDVIRNLIQCVSNCQLGGNFGDRKASCFGGQRRRTRNPWVHLNHHLLACQWVDCKLHIGSASLNADSSNAGKCCISHLLIFNVGQRHRWRNGDGVTCVDSHRINVFNRTDDHAIIGTIAHHFKFVLFPTSNRSFNQYFIDWTSQQAVRNNLFEVFFVMRDAGAATAQDVCRTNNGWQSNFVAHNQGLFHVVSHAAHRHVQSNFDHCDLKFFAILCCCDCLSIRSNQFGSTWNSN